MPCEVAEGSSDPVSGSGRPELDGRPKPRCSEWGLCAAALRAHWKWAIPRLRALPRPPRRSDLVNQSLRFNRAPGDGNTARQWSVGHTDLSLSRQTLIGETEQRSRNRRKTHCGRQSREGARPQSPGGSSSSRGSSFSPRYFEVPIFHTNSWGQGSDTGFQFQGSPTRTGRKIGGRGQ